MFLAKSFLASFAGFCLLLSFGCGGGETPAAGTETGTQAMAAGGEGEGETSAGKKPVDPATAATVEVMVKYEGDPVKNKKIKMGADPFCQSAHETAAEEEKFVRNPNNTMANAFVWIQSGGLKAFEFPTPKEKVTIDQKGCLYIPHVASATLKQELVFKNSDETLHNVHPTPKLNKEMNVAMPTKNSEEKFVFKKEELMIPTKCNVHPWMISYVNIVKHPLHGVTPKSDDGKLTISGIPPGTYTLEAIHEELGKVSMEITLKDKETKAVTLEFKKAS